MKDIYITGRGLATPAGASVGANWQALASGVPRISWDEVLGPVGRASSEVEAALTELSREKRLRYQDRATRLGLLAAREAYQEAGRPASADMAVIMGSSRGATSTVEREHDRFLEVGKVQATTSPVSTAGIFSSAVSQDLGAGRLSLSVSSACATSLNALGVGAALLETGLAKHVLAGGTEASLTPFTLAQLRATSVLARQASALYPCRPLHPERTGLVPGEGAACLLLTTAPVAPPLARLAGFGAATEAATATGVSPEAQVLSDAVAQALDQAGVEATEIGLVVGHGAGTVKGDAAELAAYRRIFGDSLPPATFHKWLTGHMIGASSAFSVVLATLHLFTGLVPGLPYFEDGMAMGSGETLRLKPRYILVTALGFGGNASAIVLAAV